MKSASKQAESHRPSGPGTKFRPGKQYPTSAKIPGGHLGTSPNSSKRGKQG